MSTHPAILQQAAIAATCNAAINGVKAWYAFRGEPAIALTLDSITGGSQSVLGVAVGSAFGLGLVGTMITFFTFRGAARKKGIALQRELRFWPPYVLLMLKNAIFVFGVLIMLAVLFQRTVGTIEVSAGAAAAVTAAIAFAVTLYTSLATMETMVRPEP